METTIKRIPKELMFPDIYEARELMAKAACTNRIFIPGEVPSKKNHQVVSFNYKTKSRFIGKNNLTKKYEQHAAIFYKQMCHVFRKQAYGKPFPLLIEFVFQRRTKGSWDYINMMQIVQDMMVHCQWIPDDSYNYLRPSAPNVIFDKNMYGVWIRVL
jgi:hypothetical protein